MMFSTRLSSLIARKSSQFRLQRRNVISNSANTTTVEPILVTAAKDVRSSIESNISSLEQQANQVKIGIIDRTENPGLLLSDLGNVANTAQDVVVSTLRPFDVFSGHYVLDFIFVAILLAFTYALLIASPRQ